MFTLLAILDRVLLLIGLVRWRKLEAIITENAVLAVNAHLEIEYLRDALEDIIDNETAGANATVKRIITVARNALKKLEAGRDLV